MSIVSGIIDDDLRTFKVNDEIVVDKNCIGEFIKNSAKLTILNKEHKYDILNNTYLEINKFGKWYVESLINNEESVEADLTLSDLSVKFDKDYEDSFSFPATMGEWATWIGNKVGVPLKGTFLNYDIELKEKPYLGNNPKYRTAVKIISKYASSWAEVNEDNTYSIKWFEDKTYNIEDWESFKHGNESKPVNIIILSTGVTEDNVRYPEQIPSNAHELRIEDDWLAIDRYSINESIYEQVNGFLYTQISELVLPFGLLEFKVGQKIKAKDIELKDIETYITSHILTWDGGDWNDPNSWTSSLKMNELNETTTKYQYSNSIENRLGKAEIICDKNNKNINLLVSEQKEMNEELANKANQSDVDSINSNLGTVNDNMETIQTDITQLTQSASNLQINITNTTTLLNKIKDNYATQDDLKNVVVNEVTTTTGYKFDKEGLIISKTGAKTSTLITEKGLGVNDSNNNSILYAGYDDSLGDTVLKTNKLIINNASRFENYNDQNSKSAVGCFWTGG